MPYTHTTLAMAKGWLAARLGDPGSVFWSNSELGIRITQALRMWGAYTGYWRDRAQFVTTAGESFYDLPAQIPALRGYNVTGVDAITDLQYHLLEPPTPALWSGTDQFSLPDLINALQRRRNQLLVETGCVITKSAVPVPAAQIGRVQLADNTIDVRRLAWIGADGTVAQLWRGDEWEFSTFQPEWPQQPDMPRMYSVSVTPPVTLQLAPPPIDNGSLTMLSVNTGTPVDTAGAVLGIPDDFAWVVYFGALADLLAQDGQARDVLRASYCEKRWEEGIELCRIAPSVAQARINDVPVVTENIRSLDAYRPDWQNGSQPPDTVAMGGLNLLAVANAPDGIYSISLDVVRNAVIPSGDGDFLQIGREFLDGILDEAQHLCAFKQGSSDFTSTDPLHARFVKAAMLQNDRLRASSRFMNALADRERREEEFRPRTQKSAVNA